jgi:hypothetical protein
MRVLPFIIQNAKTYNYEMYGNIIKTGTMYYTEKPVNIHETPQSNLASNLELNLESNLESNLASNINNKERIKVDEESPLNYENINTHHYPKLFDDNDENLINQNYKIYYPQIINIITNVLGVLKSRVQIYPETIHSFDELAFDLMINENDRVYLAEVNNNPGVVSNNIMNKITKNFENLRNTNNKFVEKRLNELQELLYKDYDDYLKIYTKSLFETIINGILEPIFNKTIPSLEEHKYFTTIKISDDLNSEPSRIKNGRLILIKSKYTKTSLTHEIIKLSENKRHNNLSRNLSSKNNEFTSVNKKTRKPKKPK